MSLLQECFFNGNKKNDVSIYELSESVVFLNPELPYAMRLPESIGHVFWQKSNNYVRINVKL